MIDRPLDVGYTVTMLIPLDMPDGQLFYESRGSGPPLLMLHAGVADSRMWDPLFAALSRDLQAIRCDLRGYGRSALPDGPFAYHEDIAALVDHLGLDRVWLLAASFGGRVAIDFCLAYPQRVQGLILIAPAVGGFLPKGRVAAFSEQEDALVEAGRLEEATELNLRMWVDGPYRKPQQVNPHLRALVFEMQLQAFNHPLPPNVSLRHLDPPALDRLEEIAAPTLVIAGALDVPEFVELSRLIAERISGARRVVVPGAAHLVSMERPDEVNQLVLEFVTR